MKRSLRSYPTNRNDLALICVYLFRHRNKQVVGIEPTCLAWKANILPLNYTCINGRRRNRTSAAQGFNLSLCQLSYPSKNDSDGD